MVAVQTATLKHRPRTRKAVEQLSSMARRLGPEGRLPTVVELRDHLGVSMRTLNDALGELESQQVIYRKAGVGIYVAPNAGQRAIALVCDPMFFRSNGASPFWHMLIDQAKSRAETHDEALNLHFSSIVGGEVKLPEAVTRDIAAGRVNGMLFVGGTEDGVTEIENCGVPVVVFAGPGPHVVRIDMDALLMMGVESLAQQGARQIAIWTPGDCWISEEAEARIRTLLATKYQADLWTGPDQTNQFKITAGPRQERISRQEAGYNAAMAAFRQPCETWPDGIIVADDTLTLGVLSALQLLGVAVGTDVKVASHSNQGIATLIGWQDRITILEVDPNLIVTEMFALLERLMGGEELAPAEHCVPPLIKVNGHS